MSLFRRRSPNCEPKTVQWLDGWYSHQQGADKNPYDRESQYASWRDWECGRTARLSSVRNLSPWDAWVP